MIAGMAETAFSHACCQFCNREIHINIIDHYVHSAHILMQRESVYATKC